MSGAADLRRGSSSSSSADGKMHARLLRGWQPRPLRSPAGTWRQRERVQHCLQLHAALADAAQAVAERPRRHCCGQAVARQLRSHCARGPGQPCGCLCAGGQGDQQHKRRPPALYRGVCSVRSVHPAVLDRLRPVARCGDLRGGRVDRCRQNAPNDLASAFSQQAAADRVQKPRAEQKRSKNLQQSRRARKEALRLPCAEGSGSPGGSRRRHTTRTRTHTPCPYSTA